MQVIDQWTRRGKRSCTFHLRARSGRQGTLTQHVRVSKGGGRRDTGASYRFFPFQPRQYCASGPHYLQQPIRGSFMPGSYRTYRSHPFACGQSGATLSRYAPFSWRPLRRPHEPQGTHRDAAAPLDDPPWTRMTQKPAVPLRDDPSWVHATKAWQKRGLGKALR